MPESPHKEEDRQKDDRQRDAGRARQEPPVAAHNAHDRFVRFEWDVDSTTERPSVRAAGIDWGGSGNRILLGKHIERLLQRGIGNVWHRLRASGGALTTCLGDQRGNVSRPASPLDR